MLKTITFQNGRLEGVRFQNGQLEGDEKILASNLVGFARITLGGFETRWDGQFYFEGSWDSGKTAFLIIPGVLAGIIHVDHLKKRVCTVSGADAALSQTLDGGE